MHAEYLIKGALVGLYVAAPVGPTTVLVIHRTANIDFRSGLLSGSGAACADALFGLVAAFGVGVVAGLIYGHERLIAVAGGTALLFWGYRIYRSRFAEEHPLVKGEGYGGPFVSTFLLTLTNPMTVLAFMAILAGLGAASIHRDFLLVMEWFLGIGAGSFAWWLGLSGAAYILRHRIDNRRTLTWMNRITGLLVIAAGVLALMTLAPETERKLHLPAPKLPAHTGTL